MRRTIRGTVYDTSTAEFLGEARHDADPDSAWVARLYRTPRSHEYFLLGEGGSMTAFASTVAHNAGSRIIPLDALHALRWGAEFLAPDVGIAPWILLPPAQDGCLRRAALGVTPIFRAPDVVRDALTTGKNRAYAAEIADACARDRETSATSAHYSRHDDAAWNAAVGARLALLSRNPADAMRHIAHARDLARMESFDAALARMEAEWAGLS